jgi:hypothetical protein
VHVLEQTLTTATGISVDKIDLHILSLLYDNCRLLLGQLEACERLLEHVVDEDKNTVESETMELKMALDFLTWSVLYTANSFSRKNTYTNDGPNSS